MQKASVQPGGWIVVWLLFFFMLINFVDKAVIGLAAVPMMKEIGLTPKQFGLVNSSFFFLFSISAIVTGFIVNRIQARWALLVMAIVWALTQFPMIGSVGLGTLLASRIVLGAGEGPAYPVALHGAYKFFPNELRAMPTAAGVCHDSDSEPMTGTSTMRVPLRTQPIAANKACDCPITAAISSPAAAINALRQRQRGGSAPRPMVATSVKHQIMPSNFSDGRIAAQISASTSCARSPCSCQRSHARTPKPKTVATHRSA